MTIKGKTMGQAWSIRKTSVTCTRAVMVHWYLLWVHRWDRQDSLPMGFSRASPDTELVQSRSRMWWQKRASLLSNGASFYNRPFKNAWPEMTAQTSLNLLQKQRLSGFSKQCFHSRECGIPWVEEFQENCLWHVMNKSFHFFVCLKIFIIWCWWGELDE